MPLYDEGSQPASWNERMAPGEYAVHSSSLDGAAGGVPSCVIFGSLAEAVAYAEERASSRPELGLRIYDHHGFAGQPVREIRGNAYKGHGEISARFRRWAGTGMLVGGLGLIALDWSTNFRLSWPAMIGIRMLAPGVILLATEAVIVFAASRARKHDSPGRTG
ncbi:MAG: hypothetical protein JWM43_4099 [Acidobacteriaceae bacterium]|nr:hypothetical protein [Acidobacteriaceae bacterium]